MRTLYRPVGTKELELIRQTGYKKFPPRLSWQPIFYPVLDYEYACTIARDWNTNDDDNGSAGFVTQFEIPDEYFDCFEVQNVGLKNHNELWVPAEKMEEFNSKLLSGIKVVKAFYGNKYVGCKDEVTHPIT
jgi:hypothetical protein